MIPATAQIKARNTFGAVGYHQTHTIENVAMLIRSGIPQSTLHSTGFKQITLLEPRGKEKLLLLTLSIVDGKKFTVEIVPSQLFWDFNQDKALDYTQLDPDKSAILFNTSADQRCSGTNIKLKAATPLAIEETDREVVVYELQTAVPNPKIYIDSLENAFK